MSSAESSQRLPGQKAANSMSATKTSKPKWRRGDGEPSASKIVTFTMVAPFSMVDVIQEIAIQLRVHLELESVPDQFKRMGYPRDTAVSDSAQLILDNICANYRKRLHWCIADRVLKFAVISNGGETLSPFDDLAGRLMHDARRKPNGRILPEEYPKIAAELDKADFTPLRYLEGRYRDDLRDWNRTYHRRAIPTFSEALKHKDLRWERDFDRESGHFIDRKLELRRAVLKRFSRALEKWNKAQTKA